MNLALKSVQMALASLLTVAMEANGIANIIERLGARWIALIIATLLVGGWFIWMIVEARMVHIKHSELSSSTLPAEFDGTRIVFASDIHAGPYMTYNRLSSLIDKVNALEPDIVILGGDYVGGKMNGASIFYPLVGEFEGSMGRLAVLGNHDIWEGEDEARDGLDAAGFTLLENGASSFERDGARIWIAGVEDADTGNPDAKVAAEEIPADEFAMLVSHNPDIFAAQLPETEGRWDLAMAGHTHGGQISIGEFTPFSISRFGKRYRTGWKEEAGTPILVSNGVGTVTAPLRFFTRPEINVITLRSVPEGAPQVTATTP